MKKFVLKLIRLYQRTLSPDEGWPSFKYPHGYCRFYPHCSEYGYRAIDRHGLFKGLFLTGKRILKCNPFNKGGYDPVNE